MSDAVSKRKWANTMNEVKKELINKNEYDFSDLVTIMKLLRAPDGCPWDIEQTHRSIRKNFIEETYEACEAIDKEDDELLVEELGDVILQVVFHARIAEERGAFDISRVLTGVCSKLIHRHPHIFGDVVANTSGQVLENWEKIKLEEKHTSHTVDDLNRVCSALPALMRCSKLIKKANGSGYEYYNVMPNSSDDKDIIARQLMDTCRLAREKGIDPEEALSSYCDSYLERANLKREKEKESDDENR